jgi:hypothetical protein
MRNEGDKKGYLGEELSLYIGAEGNWKRIKERKREGKREEYMKGNGERRIKEGRLGKRERAECRGKNKEEDIRKRKMLKGKRGEYKKGDGERRNKRREGWVKGKEQNVERKIRKKILEGRGEKTEARRMRGREQYYNGGCLAGSVVG